jgi:hypothetical protein
LSENWERQKSHAFQEILPGSSFSRKMPLGRSGTHGPTQQKYGGFLEYTSILRGFSIMNHPFWATSILENHHIESRNEDISGKSDGFDPRG